MLSQFVLNYFNKNPKITPKIIFNKIINFLFILLTTYQVTAVFAETSPFPTTNDNIKTETRFTQYALENFHILRSPIKSLDNEKLLRHYIEQFDPIHLFLTEEEVTQIILPFKDNLTFYIQQGNLYPAFDIFESCHNKCNETLQYIFKRLDDPFDLYIQNTFTPDRRKLPWPKNQDAKIQLWEYRLQHDLISEILGENHSLSSSDSFLYHWKTQNKLTNFLQTNPADKTWNLLIQKTYKSLEPQWYSIWNLDYIQNIHAHQELEDYIKHKQALQNYDKICNKIKDRYKRLKESLASFEKQDIAEIFLSTLTHEYDPHSVFFSADSMEEFSIAVRNSLVGIGAVLSDEDGYCIIKELIPGGPAAKSQQLKPGDAIVGIGDDNSPMVDVIGMKLRDTVKKIRGKQGTPIHLLIQPADSDRSTRKTITLVRDEVELTTSLASSTLFTLPHKTDNFKIGVIDLPTFYGSDDDQKNKTSTTEDVNELIEKLKKEGTQGLILDLRQNGGGLLPEAISLTGLFIPTGPVLQVKDTLNQINEYLDNDPTIAWKGPLIILVSRYSASASEIVAGALKDSNRALIVGDPTTHGKGTVQAILDVDRSHFGQFKKNRMGSLKITIQKWYRPSGESTQLKGVESDIALSSINPYLPIGESDLPQALPWDKIYSIPWVYDIQYSIDDKLKQQLINNSKNRQQTLPEFIYLQEQVDWLKKRQEDKNYSLNLDERLKTQKRDFVFQDTLYQKFENLSQPNYGQTSILLDTAIAAEKSSKEDFKEKNYDLSNDIHLKEALRIMEDWLALQKNDRTPPNPS